MKKCIICGKEIPRDKYDVCKNCFEFIKWKYKGNLKEKIQQFEKVAKERQDSLNKYWEENKDEDS